MWDHNSETTGNILHFSIAVGPNLSMSFSQKISLKHNLKLNYQRLLLLTENNIVQNKAQKLREVKTILHSDSKDTKNIKTRKYSGE